MVRLRTVAVERRPGRVLGEGMDYSVADWGLACRFQLLAACLACLLTSTPFTDSSSDTPSPLALQVR